MANNQLLLLQDVDNLGRAGDLVSVRAGYARNFLMPKGLAIGASKAAMRRQKQLQEERAQKAAEDRQAAEGVAKQIASKPLSVHVKVDPEGHMYGSVSALDVVRLVKEGLDIDLEKRSVMMDHAIKTTGLHTVEISLPEGVQGQVSVEVLPDQEDAGGVVAEIPEAESEAAGAEQ